MKKKIIHLGFMGFVTWTAALYLVGCHGMKARRQEAKSHYEYGILYLQNSKYHLAQREFQKAGELNPKDYRLYNGLGLTYYFQGKFSLAIKEYEKSIKLNPKYPDAYNNMASAFAKLKQWPKVIHYTDKALSILSYTTPEFAYYNKGVAYYHLGEYEKAQTELEISLELEENYIDPHYQLGLTKLKLKLYSGASEEFQKVIQLLPMARDKQGDPLLADSRYYLAISYYYSNQKNLAAKEFQKVIELAPESDRAQEARQYLSKIEVK